jgi:hypothetical protein
MASKAVLQFLRGKAHRTWSAGYSIQNAVSHITVALTATIQFIAQPTPTPSGPEATIDVLQAAVADKLSGFNGLPLLIDLEVAVVADCAEQAAAAASLIQGLPNSLLATPDPLPPLTGAALEAFKFIKRQPKGKGVQAKDIIAALRKKGIVLKRSTFYKHIAPQLRERGVRNSPAAGGYLIPVADYTDPYP